MTAPIVFLDIDGVLVTWASMGQRHPEYRCHLFAPDCVAELNRITETTGARVVVSSTWREGTDEQFEHLISYLRDQGVRGPVVGRTPRLEEYVNGIYLAHPRGSEIQAWLNETEYSGPFVILDDNNDMAHLSDRLVQSSMETGLTREHADRAISLLGAS